MIANYISDKLEPSNTNKFIKNIPSKYYCITNIKSSNHNNIIYFLDVKPKPIYFSRSEKF